MFEQFLKPASVDEAVKFKTQFKDDAVFMAGGSKLNAAPTRSTKSVAISLAGLGLGEIKAQGGQVTIGATATLQQVIDSPVVPAAVREAAGFVYSRNVRNQATFGGELFALQNEAVLLPALLVLNAKVLLSGGADADLASWLNGQRDALVLGVVLPEANLCCATRKIARSAGGLTVLTAAVALAADGQQRIAIEGVVSSPARLAAVEQKQLTGEALQTAVSEAVAPVADLRGSVSYKRYIAGVVVADLLADCQQMIKEK